MHYLTPRPHVKAVALGCKAALALVARCAGERGVGVAVGWINAKLGRGRLGRTRCSVNMSVVTMAHALGVLGCGHTP